MRWVQGSLATGHSQISKSAYSEDENELMSQQPRSRLSQWSVTSSNHIPSVYIGCAIDASAWLAAPGQSVLIAHRMEKHSFSGVLKAALAKILSLHCGFIPVYKGE